MKTAAAVALLLVACGPGQLVLHVDTDALVEALRSGRIRAALDVTDPEPLPADSELWRLPNVILSPHSSYASDRLSARAADRFLDNLARFRAGQELRNVVDLEAGY